MKGLITMIIVMFAFNSCHLHSLMNGREDFKAITLTKYDSLGKVLVTWIMKYDANGNMIEEIGHKSDHTIDPGSGIREYDDKGRLIEDIKLDKDSSAMFVQRFTYNNDREEPVKDNFYQKGKSYQFSHTRLFTYVHDSNGNVIEARWIDSVYHSPVYINRFRYDTAGNKIEMVEYIDNDTQGITQYGYDGHIKKPRMERYTSKEGTMIKIYDTVGKISVDSFFDMRGYRFRIDKGFLYNTVRYQYDCKGNLIEKESVSRTPLDTDLIDISIPHEYTIKTTFRYDYDKAGNWIKKYVNGSKLPVEIRELEQFR